jgi:hypothetical protein
MLLLIVAALFVASVWLNLNERVPGQWIPFRTLGGAASSREIMF